MVTRKRVDSWVVTDEFWERVEPLIPERARVKGKEYLRKPGAGRPPKPARQVFEAVMYVLRTGCQWKALPKERFGSASAVHKRFLEWEEAGVFEAIWRAGLAEYDQMEGIAEYALTGSVIARDRQVVAQVTDKLRFAAGNFYINDKPTGAVVGQQPFGGARASGTNDKAGSPLNLVRWVSPRAIKETMVPPTDYRYPHMG